MSMRMAGLAAGLVLVCAAAQAADIKVVNDKTGFPEGPIVLDGKLYYVEYGGNTIMVWDGKANAELWKMDGCGPSAVYPYQGDLVVTCYDSSQIARVSMDGKTVATYDKDAAGGAFLGNNDFTSDGKGGVYFSGSGPWESAPIVGKVYHMAADGKITEVANDLHYANGLALTPDGKRLLVAESEAGRVISFAIGDDGSLSDRRLFVRVGVADPASGIGAYPDGLEFGPDGNFYIGQYSSGRIVVVDPEGNFIKAIEVPSPAAPNMTFSADGKTLYVTAVDDTSNAPYWGKVYAVTLE